MLADDVKKDIQSTYRQLLESRDLTPRYGQRLMIAEIAKTLSTLTDDESEPPICVVEAGTGTGKTMAYVLAVSAALDAVDVKGAYFAGFVFEIHGGRCVSFLSLL